MTKPSETPYLRFGGAERPIMGPAAEIVGNARALLQPRARIDRASKDRDIYPLDEAPYRDAHEYGYEVVSRAKSRAQMEPSAPPKVEVERESWAERTRNAAAGTPLLGSSDAG